MIVGCYSLDLYCDNEEAHFVARKSWQKEGRYAIPLFEATGRSRAACLRSARKAGWSIDLNKRIVRCPKCKGGRIARGKIE